MPTSSSDSTLFTRISTVRTSFSYQFFVSRAVADSISLHLLLVLADGYLEINPLICLDGVNGAAPTIEYLDMAAKLDQVRSETSVLFSFELN